MNIRRTSILAVTLFLFELLFELRVGSATYIESAGDFVLTGELVITNAARNQFRLVGHSGVFTAPAGTSIEALDGKPVEVELGRNRRILEISEMPMHFPPIVHGVEVIRGQLNVADAVDRTFTMAGDDRLYIGPAAMDIRPYGGRIVEVLLGSDGTVQSIEIAKAASRAPLTATCLYNGEGFSEGGSVCQSGTQYRCVSGAWRSLGSTCAWGGTTAARSSRTCIFYGATVASGSSICRNGTTFRCADGEWVNLGTACS
jgi:hypothetical protein